MLDKDKNELKESAIYLEVKLTTDKACVFGFSIVGGASAIVGATELVKRTGGASIVIAAKGGVSLKKAVEKIDLAYRYAKKSENAFKQYDELNGGRYTVGYSVTPKYSTYENRVKYSSANPSINGD